MSDEKERERERERWRGGGGVWGDGGRGCVSLFLSNIAFGVIECFCFEKRKEERRRRGRKREKRLWAAHPEMFARFSEVSGVTWYHLVQVQHNLADSFDFSHGQAIENLSPNKHSWRSKEK